MGKHYVLQARPWNGGGCAHFDGYYTGRTYIHQGERYAVVDRTLAKAKRYKTEAGAWRGMESLNGGCVNYLFDVAEIRTDGDEEVEQA